MDLSQNHSARQPEDKPRWSYLLLVIVGVSLALTSCEESVDPIIGTDVPFTLWGFFNAGADTQRVRIYPITSEILPDARQGLDARVFSTDLTTGERREWTYKAVAVDSLISGHVFWSPFRAVHERRYRLEVVRSDGVTSSVEVTVPPPVTFEVEMPENDLQIPVRVEGQVPNLIGVQATYYATNVPPTNAWPPSVVIHPPVELPISIFYDAQVERDDDAWKVVIDMQRDFNILRLVYGLSCLITPPDGSAPDIWLESMEVTAVAADSTWAPPGGVFDPNILAVPGTFTNVKNGYGFFGAGQGIREHWVPSIMVRRLAGFNFEPRCDSTATPDQRQCLNPPVPCLGDDARDVWQLWLR